MQESSRRASERSHNESWLTSLVRYVCSHRGIRVSISTGSVLLAWDAVLSGSFVMSLIVCPIWFVASVVKNVIQRHGWRVALLRMAVPLVTLGLVLANTAVQLRIAKANATRITAACEKYHEANGEFPQKLDELVPRYLPSIPRAKYCFAFGEFFYWNIDGHAMLVWYDVPPFGRRIYDFAKRKWNYLD